MYDFIFNKKKPKVRKDAPLMIDLFSGGGGVKTGAISAGFISIGVEKDPNNPELSKIFSNWHDVNFAEYGSKTYLETVQEMCLKGWQGLPRNTLIAHASPVCSHFCGYRAVNRAKEDAKDITSAKAVADAIAVLDAQYWTIEQVTEYVQSESFKIICTALWENGYSFILEPKIDFYEWGVIPQNRKRMFLLAWKRDLKPLEFPPKLKPWGWGKCLGSLNLVPDTPLDWQEKAISQFNKPYTAFAVQRVGRFRDRDGDYRPPKMRSGDEPIWTITKHAFHNSPKTTAGIDRHNPFNIYIPGKGWFYPHPRAIARIAGFPDWFRFSPKPYYYGSVFGYSVPPSWIYRLLSHNFIDYTKEI